mgnify:CR=1 FL=1
MLTGSSISFMSVDSNISRFYIVLSNWSRAQKNSGRDYFSILERETMRATAGSYHSYQDWHKYRFRALSSSG